MIEAFLQLLGRQGFQTQAAANAAGDGQQVGLFQTGGQAVVAGQNDGQDRAGVQVGAGQQAQFGQDQGVHLLGFVDDQHRPIGGGLDVGEPLFPEGFGAVPAVIGREGHAEQMAQFAVKVGHFSLGSGQGADAQIPQAL